MCEIAEVINNSRSAELPTCRYIGMPSQTNVYEYRDRRAGSRYEKNLSLWTSASYRRKKASEQYFMRWANRSGKGEPGSRVVGPEGFEPPTKGL
jgi:hypothetical protein